MLAAVHAVAAQVQPAANARAMLLGAVMASNLCDIEAATPDVLTAVHTVADKVLPPENAKAMGLGLAAMAWPVDRSAAPAGGARSGRRLYRTIKRQAGVMGERLMQSAREWTLAPLVALSVTASAGCGQSVDVRGKDQGNNRPMIGEDAYRRQVDLDVAAIVAGMTRAHGAQAVALLPKWWQDLLLQR